MQGVFIFAEVHGDFSRLSLHTTVTLSLLRDGSTVISNSITINLPMLPIPHSHGWYVASIPGLPAKTVKGAIYTWEISSHVEYSLLIDDVQVASGSYTVIEGMAIHKQPLVFTAVYDVTQNPALIRETIGLGPRGWIIGANEQLKALILAMDSEGVKDVTFEYSVDGEPWNVVAPIEDPLMSPTEELVSKLNNIIDNMNSLLPSGLRLQNIAFSTKIYHATIPGQMAGHYVMFRANVTDVDGNEATSPIGFYFVVNETSDIKILIIDPHVKLWLFQQNLKQFFELLIGYSSYQVPSGIIGNMTMLNQVAAVIEKYGVEPFHHWELLGKRYDLYIAWPDKRIVDLLKSRVDGGFEPNVVVLSNLALAFNGTERPSPWNWDLMDAGVLDDMIKYVKETHAGLIATHGTLSDWIIWTSVESKGHYKVRARGHIGEVIEDINIVNESTIAALLGMPELALWEYARDQIAYLLCASEETMPLGLVFGSIPLQVLYIPFNGSMKTMPEARYLRWDISEEFNILIPSVYNEFNVSAYTQVGWQLVMPRALAYVAWWKAREARPLAEKLHNKLSKLMENITHGIYPSENAMQHMGASLRWGLQNLYRSIISANISGTTFIMVIDVPDLKKNFTITIDVGEAYNQLLQLLPVRLVALSKDGLAGIVTYDKYWDPGGYRSVYFSFEVEAAEGEIAEALLVNAVNWSLRWQYKDGTDLLGNIVRVPKELAVKFNNTFAGLPGNPTVSRGLILNEEGYTKIELSANASEILRVLIAHPTSDDVKVEVLGGSAEINMTKVAEQLTLVIVEATEAGKVTLGLRAGSQSALSPAYVAVKQEVIAAPPLIEAWLPYVGTVIIAVAILTIIATLIKRRKRYRG